METRIETDGNGRKRLLAVTSCPCCRRCWKYLDTGVCLYGGPFSGYSEAPPSKEGTASSTVQV